MMSESRPNEVVVAGLRQWLNTAVSTIAIDRFNEIHIDEVCPAFASRAQWLKGMFECAFGLMSFMDRFRITWGVAVSLKSAEHYLGVTYHNVTALEHEFSWSQPSCYLFARGSEPWRSDKKHTLAAPLDVSPPTGCTYWHYEYSDDHEATFRRSWWIAPSDG